MAEKKTNTKGPRLFQIHNLVRRVETRAARQHAPRRSRFNLLLGGGMVRVVRARHATVTESMIAQLRRELLQREAAGELKVTTATGQRVDINTLKVVEGMGVSSPLPHPPLDDAARDNQYEIGVGMPTQEGGRALSENVKKPEVLEPQLPEGFEPGSLPPVGSSTLSPPPLGEPSESEAPPSEDPETAEVTIEEGEPAEPVQDEINMSVANLEGVTKLEVSSDDPATGEASEAEAEEPAEGAAEEDTKSAPQEGTSRRRKKRSRR